MNRTIKKFSSWIATVALWGAQVAVLQAAQLDSFSGKVLINRGDGFESAGQLAQLKAGDKLMVSQSGQATLAFQSCHVTFTGANLYTVPAIRPCASGGDIAIANGVFVTPVAAPVSQAEQLDGITALGRSIQSAAQTSNDAIGLSCVNGKLGEIAALARGQSLAEAGIYDRHGVTAPRKSGDIGFAVVRAGDIIGDHTVYFAGTGERIEITHKSSSRENYAEGALRAAKFLANKKVGLFDMQDVLGLK